MRKLRIFEHMSLDGVIQNSRGQGESLAAWKLTHVKSEPREELLLPW